MPTIWNFPLHPPRASTFADEIDVLWFALVGLTLLFTIIVFIMLTVFAFRYRKGSKADRSNPIHTSHTLELSWSIIPLILALFIFAWGAKLYADVYKTPDNAKEVFVIGKQWMWHIQHSNGIRENNELHVPVGQPIKLTMISQDVIHAFFVPEFRIQKFVNPGQYTSMWFTATVPGKYHIFCNQYCGTQHSLMGGYVYVLSPEDFQRWQDSNGYRGGEFNMARRSMAEEGAELYESIGCVNCHNANSSRRGPSLYNYYGTKRQMTNGETVEANRDYVRESIVNAGKRVTAGYENIMPDYSSLKEDQVNSLIAYIKSLGTPQEPKATPKAESTGTPGVSSTAPKPTTASDTFQVSTSHDRQTPRVNTDTIPKNGSSIPTPAGKPAAENNRVVLPDTSTPESRGVRP